MLFRSLRLAISGRNIRLFGEGEELRDHVSIKYVAQLAASMLVSAIPRTINAASGKLYSFKEIAQIICQFHKDTDIDYVPRNGPVPHMGYRRISISRAQNLFERISVPNLQTDLEQMIIDIKEG